MVNPMSFPEATGRPPEANVQRLTHGISTAEAFEWAIPQCPYRARKRAGHLKQLFHLSTLGWNTLTIFKITNIEFSGSEHFKIFFILNKHISNKDHKIVGFENHLDFSENAVAFLREQVEIATHILRKSLFLFSNNFYLRSLDMLAKVFKLFFQSRVCIAILKSLLLMGLRKLKKPLGFDHLRKLISRLKAYFLFFLPSFFSLWGGDRKKGLIFNIRNVWHWPSTG